MDGLITSEGKSLSRITIDSKNLFNMSQSTTQRALKRLKTAGLVNYSGGLYWRTVISVTSLKE